MTGVIRESVNGALGASFGDALVAVVLRSGRSRLDRVQFGVQSEDNSPTLSYAPPP
jgi:hypothetical protein